MLESRRRRRHLGRHPGAFKGSHTGPLVHLELEDGATAKSCKARPVPLVPQGPIEDDLDRVQRQGTLKPTQHTEWATPLALVRKNDGTPHVWGDYRSTVNAAAKKASYPLPTTEELFANLRGGSPYSTLDLYQAYRELKVNDKTAALLTVNTTKGLFKVERLPSGVIATPATFQRMMKTTLAGIPGVNVRLDDVVVSGKSATEHAQHLNQVPSRLSEKGPRLKKEKYRFGITSVKLLGHRVDASAVHTTDIKV